MRTGQHSEAGAGGKARASVTRSLRAAGGSSTAARLALTVGMLSGCTPEAVPDVSYEVTVTGVTNGCTTDTSGYRETFQYDLFFDNASVLIQVDDVPMATGEIVGCKIEYQTSVWLEDRDNDTYLRWQMTGDGAYQGLAGGCVDDPYDWETTETITVTESTDPSIVAGCTYTMTANGNLL